MDNAKIFTIQERKCIKSNFLSLLLDNSIMPYLFSVSLDGKVIWQDTLIKNDNSAFYDISNLKVGDIIQIAGGYNFRSMPYCGRIINIHRNKMEIEQLNKSTFNEIVDQRKKRPTYNNVDNIKTIDFNYTQWIQHDAVGTCDLSIHKPYLFSVGLDGEAIWQERLLIDNNMVYYNIENLKPGDYIKMAGGGKQFKSPYHGIIVNKNKTNIEVHSINIIEFKNEVNLRKAAFASKRHNITSIKAE